MTASDLSRAQNVLVGGVNSPVRAFTAVGGQPPFIDRAHGAHLFDSEGKIYIDYINSWGPAILGHAHPEVVAVVKAAADKGLSFGAPTIAEIELAELLVNRIDSLEMIRCVSSGTEATMSALRVARGATGRPLIVKFDGGYHGHSDCLLVQAGSGAATFGHPDSAGIPADIVKNTVNLAYNDLPKLEALFAEHPTTIAGVIVEPVSGNMGVVPPEPGFLEGIIALCEKYGAVSIFDEVMTGCRLSPSGAQGYYGLKPALSCFGKVVGGGLPLAVYGGKKELMQQVSPLGPIYQAGTLSGNPLSVAAARKTLELMDDAAYLELEKKGATLQDGIQSIINDLKLDACVQRVGSMVTLFFSKGPIKNWIDSSASDKGRFAVFHQALLERGVYWPPSQFEAAFISLAHTDAILQETIAKIRLALMAVSEEQS